MERAAANDRKQQRNPTPSPQKTKKDKPFQVLKKVGGGMERLGRQGDFFGE